MFKGFENGYGIAYKTFNDLEQGWNKNSLREFFALSNIPKHPGILNFYYVNFYKNKPVFATKLLKCTLSTYILNHTMTSDKILNISCQLIDAISHIHKYGFVHRDIKMENILMDENEDIVVCDFGMCRHIDSKDDTNNYSNHVCTLWTKSPQLLNGDKKYDNLIDSWSLGCVLLALSCKNYILKGNDTKSVLKNIQDYLNTSSKLLNIKQSINRTDLPEQFYLLIQSFLEIDTQNRLSVLNANKMELVQKYNYRKPIKELCMPFKEEYVLANNELKFETTEIDTLFKHWIINTLNNFNAHKSTIDKSIDCFVRIKYKTVTTCSAVCSLIFKLNETKQIKSSVWAKIGNVKIFEFLDIEKSIVKELCGKLWTVSEN